MLHSPALPSSNPCTEAQPIQYRLFLLQDFRHPRYAVWSAVRIKPNEQKKIEQIKQLGIQVDQTGLEGMLSYQLGGEVVGRQAWRDERVWLR